MVLEKDKEDHLDRSVKNEALKSIKVKRNILNTIKRKAKLIGHILHSNYLIKHFIEGKMEGSTEVTRRRGRRCEQTLVDFNENRWHWNLKQKARDRALWRTRL
jgi:hypothetical protein